MFHGIDFATFYTVYVSASTCSVLHVALFICKIKNIFPQ